MSNYLETATTASGGGESRKRKRRKFEKLIDDRTIWRSDSERRIYSTKLLDALRLQNTTSNPLTVRAAADRVLAVTAKGRTRWSRAILKNHHRRLHIHSRILKKVSKKNPNKLAIATSSRSIGASRPEKLPAVEKRVRFLGRLVPGCRKLSFPSLLEETTDYISALEMQVRAMATLAQLLTVTGGSAPSLTSTS